MRLKSSRQFGVTGKLIQLKSLPHVPGMPCLKSLLESSSSPCQTMGTPAAVRVMAAAVRATERG